MGVPQLWHNALLSNRSCVTERQRNFFYRCEHKYLGCCELQMETPRVWPKIQQSILGVTKVITIFVQEFWQNTKICTNALCVAKSTKQNGNTSGGAKTPDCIENATNTLGVKNSTSLYWNATNALDVTKHHIGLRVPKIPLMSHKTPGCVETLQLWQKHLIELKQLRCDKILILKVSKDNTRLYRKHLRCDRNFRNGNAGQPLYPRDEVSKCYLLFTCILISQANSS